MLARSIGVAVLVPVIVIGLSRSVPVSAAMLEVPDRQILEAGQKLQLPLTIDGEQGPRIEISLGVAPEGASLVLQDSGLLQLEWQTGPDLAAETTIELLVRDIDSNEYLNSVYVMIRRPEGGAESGAVTGELDASPELPGESAIAIPPETAPASSTGAEQTESQVVTLETPSFAVMPNQVVSVGRIVTLRVSASLPGEYLAVLQIDRLPRNASFEADEYGGRTFRWETSKDDEGEHLFRFTAFNPRAPEKRTMKEVWVVVGDPSKKTNLPEPVSSDW